MSSKSSKTDHKERAYELLRKSDFGSPFTFGDWLMGKKYVPLREKLRERKYTVKDTDIPYRTINYWELSGLMPEGVNIGDRQKESSWRIFSIVEIAWLKVVDRLRGFGLSIKQIHVIKQYVIHWNKTTECYPSFEYCLSQALFSPKDTYLRVLVDGSSDLVSAEGIEMEKIIKGSGDMLLVSIKSILGELDLSFPEIRSRLELSEEEFELFNEIRQKANEEVKVKTKKGKITEIEFSKTDVSSFSDRDIRNRAKEEEMYGQVDFQYEKGRQRSVKIITRKRFDKK
ncbi:MAG: MerR family transcriptional regulator [Patescibacteria group bacterium]